MKGTNETNEEKLKAVYSVAQVQAYEAMLVSTKVVTMEGLLSKASGALFRICRQCTELNERILIVCGKGLNGADGLMLAGHMAAAGFQVSVYCCAEIRDCKELAQLAYEYAMSKGVIESKKIDLKQVDVCIDAMLGIGFEGKVSANLLKIIESSFTSAMFISL